MTEDRRDDEAHDIWRTRIDTDVRSLSERLAGVETGVTALGRSFDRFAHTFETSEGRQQELIKTRWPLVLSAITLGLIIVGGFLSGYIRDLNRVERGQAAIEQKVERIKGDRKSAEDPRQDIELKDLNAEVTSMRGNEHDTIEHAADARARIRAIERHLFGNASTIHVED